MDLAKTSAIQLKYGGPLTKYYGEHNVPGPIVDVICVPTTSGTGSEVSPVAVVTDPDRYMKVGIATRRIIPKWAVVDPSLVVSCPPHVTSHSGMDALSHAIESFVPGFRRPHSPCNLCGKESGVRCARHAGDQADREITADRGS